MASIGRDDVESMAAAGLDDASYVRISFGQVWSELGTLLPATVIALLIAAPWLIAVALGVDAVGPLLCGLFGAPAWVGLLGVAASVTRGEPCSPLRVVWFALRSYPPSAILGGALGGFAWALERSIDEAGRVGAAAVPLVAASGGATLILLAVATHAFPLLALRGGSARSVARVALALVAIAPGAAIGLLGAGGLTLVAIRWLGPGLLLGLLPVVAVLSLNNTRRQVARCAARPGQRSRRPTTT